MNHSAYHVKTRACVEDQVSAPSVDEAHVTSNPMTGKGTFNDDNDHDLPYNKQSNTASKILKINRLKLCFWKAVN